MTDERWQRIESMFADAVALRGDAKAKFLDEACENDAALREEIETLLQADERNRCDGSVTKSGRPCFAMNTVFRGRRNRSRD